MKKLALLGVVSILIISLSGCSTSKTSYSENKNTNSTQEDKKSSNSPMILEVPETVTADNTGKVIISGTSSPNAKVKIGVLGDSKNADENGKFDLITNIPDDEKDKTVEITSKLDGNKISKKVLIKQNPEVIQTQVFNPQNLIKIFKNTKNSDTMTMIGKPENATKNADTSIMKINYTIKDKNSAMAYAQSDAKAFFKSLISNLPTPTSDFTSITIYFTYNFGNQDKTMFRIILDKDSLLKLEQINGDYTSLDKNSYLIEPEFENL